jgi:hypothetical protein
MKVVDAPRSGWYPDPTGSARLRWWDGTDWTDTFRPPPTVGELARLKVQVTGGADTVASAAQAAKGQLSRSDMETVVAEVRQVARKEVDRAAEIFQQRATSAARQFQPLVTEYTNRLLRWLKILLVVAVIALVGWVVFYAIAEVTFFEWLGDRIDALTE